MQKSLKHATLAVMASLFTVIGFGEPAAETTESGFPAAFPISTFSLRLQIPERGYDESYESELQIEVFGTGDLVFNAYSYDIWNPQEGPLQHHKTVALQDGQLNLLIQKLHEIRFFKLPNAYTSSGSATVDPDGMVMFFDGYSFHPTCYDIQVTAGEVSHRVLDCARSSADLRDLEELVFTIAGVSLYTWHTDLEIEQLANPPPGFQR